MVVSRDCLVGGKERDVVVVFCVDGGLVRIAITADFVRSQQSLSQSSISSYTQGD